MDDVAVISSREITWPDVVEVLAASGGEVIEGEKDAGMVFRDERQIWVYLSNRTLMDFDSDDLAAIIAKLGHRPQSCIVLELLPEPGSGLLAVEFAARCAERWPCVVHDFGGRVYSPDEIRELLDAGIGFDDVWNGRQGNT